MKGAANPAWRGGFDPYYGPDWKRQSTLAKKRDHYCCRHCGKSSKDTFLHVHHIRPLRFFKRDFDAAHNLDNLITLCRRCHIKEEWRTTRQHPTPQPTS
jgi:5-methylcytosine-specific restriction endonuclease McrA